MAMTQRERYLAIGVSVVVGLFGIQYGVSSLRGALELKQDLLKVEKDKSDDLRRTMTDGMIASKKIGELTRKSLPTDSQAAIAQYGDWLIKISEAAGIENIKSIPPSNALAISNSAYAIYNFKLTGECRTDEAIEFLGKFYSKDYLHTLASIKLTPAGKEGNLFSISIAANALALKGASPTQEPSDSASGRLAMSIDEYKEVILNRNPFSPPNQPPSLSTASKLTLTRGESWSEELAAKDPEAHPIDFALVSTDSPKGLELQGNRLKWKPEEVGEFEVTVEVSDGGWPRRSVEKKLTLVVVDPPKPEEKVEPPKFDVATQTFVSALVSGRNGPEAMVRSRTDNNRFDLTPGQEIEVGSIKAKVVSINVQEGFIEFETDGAHWTVGMDSSLAAAFEKSKAD